jgi:transcriptional regulator with XRE-family HTH domain
VIARWYTSTVEKLRNARPPTLAIDAGRTFAAARRAIGWTQRELARRTGIPQTAISRFERGLPSGLDLGQIERLANALGGRARLMFEAPFLADRERQRERLHSRCQAAVASCLRSRGWITATEVEIDGSFGPGWIDVLAYHPAAGALLVIEIKTEIQDVGRIVRTLDWYERRAFTAARTRGWAVRATSSCLLVLSTEAVEVRLRENRAFIAEVFPSRARTLEQYVEDPVGAAMPQGRSIAGIDPLSRRRDWIRPTNLDRRRSPPAYADYAAAARRLEGRG